MDGRGAINDEVKRESCHQYRRRSVVWAVHILSIGIRSVPILAAAGFPSAGGRLEQIDGRPAAALVFHRRQHAINLFIWPANAGSVASRTTGAYGYHVESWTKDGFNFFAVSEIPAAELEQFTAAFRAAAE